ncbi:hypothetical protein BRADI_2g26305v3 [Brachypodium distachyon]|uniref:Uncharacterized protein n=1 Tax=Brachypodium distachyon TaxID=15368 RepID=A0A2K2DAL4_BRADI|nr:hypothetical protein BRADI_2g26305v3 [Brachypodium distachyon]
MPLKIEKHPEEDVHGGDGAKPSLPPPPQPRGASLERPGKTGDAARDREARGVRRPWRPRRRWSRLILTSRHRRLCLVCHRYRGLRKTDDVSAAEVCGKSCGGVEEGEGVWSAGARLREAAVRAGATARAVRPHRHGPVAESIEAKEGFKLSGECCRREGCSCDLVARCTRGACSRRLVRVLQGGFCLQAAARW